MIISTAREGNDVCMGGPCIPIRVASLDVSVTCGIKGLHLHKSEGARTVKAFKDNIGDVGKAGPLGLHEGLHALILPPTRSAVDKHPIPP